MSSWRPSPYVPPDARVRRRSRARSPPAPEPMPRSRPWPTGRAAHLAYERGSPPTCDDRRRSARPRRAVSARTSCTSRSGCSAAGDSRALRVRLSASGRGSRQVGDGVIGQSHAWLEAWLGGWYPVDPTNGADVGRASRPRRPWPRLRRRRAVQGRVPRPLERGRLGAGRGDAHALGNSEQSARPGGLTRLASLHGDA